VFLCAFVTGYHRLTSTMPPIKNVDHRDVYNTLCPQLPVLISSLMNLPHSKIWIHERHIHKAARVPKSQYFGQWHALSSIIKTITNGCGGNKKLGTRVVVDAEYAGCNFSVTSGTNAHSVAFISFGQKESFTAGDSNGDADKTPHWFRFGSSTYCDTATQLSIVSDATGDNSSLDSVVRYKRKRNVKGYCQGTDTRGYNNIDVPLIAHKFYNQLREIFESDLRLEYIVHDSKTKEVLSVDRRAFTASELDRFSEILKVMIICSTTKYGEIRAVDGKWLMQVSGIRSSSRANHLQPRSFTPPPGHTSTDSDPSHSYKFTPPPNDSLCIPTLRSTGTNRILSRSNSNEIPDALRFGSLGKLCCLIHLCFAQNV
jgi:hypothetical protein